MKKLLYALFCTGFVCIILSTSTAVGIPGNLYVSGRYLRTPCGDTIIIRGMNKMIIYTGDTALRRQTYAEIRKTGANCTRIVWLASPTDQIDATPAGLDRAIQGCIDNDMIPMPELHDATGDWTQLQNLVNYWISPDVLSVIKKHEKYLIINIGNEVGSDQITNDQFTSGYSSVVLQMRNAGIHVPLVIDAATWGKNLDQLVATGQAIIANDPDHNLIFSVHMYWAISDGADSTYITDELLSSVNANIPLIVGEFSYKFAVDSTCDYTTNYQIILKDCQQYGIGWLPWEWGPGNGYFYSNCSIMDMTTDSYFSTLQSGWAMDVAETNNYSIANTSKTPNYIKWKGNCDSIQTSVADNTSDNISNDIYPNPVSDILYLPQSADMNQPVQIYTVEGIKIFGSYNKSSLDLSGLSAGMYFLKNGTKFYKFVKL